MRTRKKASCISDQGKAPEIAEYKIDKMHFIVHRVFNEDSNKTIHDILLKWMIRDVEENGINKTK